MHRIANPWRSVRFRLAPPSLLPHSKQHRPILVVLAAALYSSLQLWLRFLFAASHCHPPHPPSPSSLFSHLLCSCCSLHAGFSLIKLFVQALQLSDFTDITISCILS